MRPVLHCLLLIALSFNGAVVSAQERYSFLITDTSGQPLEDVVVEPVSASAAMGSNLAVATIDQVNKRFKPEQIVVEQGQSVDFPNSDNIRHHVYSFSKAKTFELKLYADTPERPVDFNQHGVVVLGCNIHDTMIGYIFVSNSSETVVTDVKGQATLMSSQPLTVVNLWHKNQVIGPEKLREQSLTGLARNQQGQYLIQIAIEESKPTNSFEDTFDGFPTAN